MSQGTWWLNSYHGNAIFMEDIYKGWPKKRPITLISLCGQCFLHRTFRDDYPNREEDSCQRSLTHQIQTKLKFLHLTALDSPRFDWVTTKI